MKNHNDMRKIINLTEGLFKEGSMDNHNGELEKKFDDMEEWFIKARRTLGKINQMPNSEQKSRHRSQTMSYINTLRKQLEQTMNQLGWSPKEIAYHKQRMGLDREMGKPAEVFSYDKYKAPVKSVAPVNKEPEQQSRNIPSKMAALKAKWFGKFRNMFSHDSEPRGQYATESKKNK